MNFWGWVRLCFFAVLGLTLANMGYTIDTIGFWAVITAAIGIQFSATLEVHYQYKEEIDKNG